MIAALMPNYARAGPKTGIPASPMTPRPMKPLDAIGRSAMSINPVSFVADLGQARSRSAYTLASASIRPCRKSLNTGARSASVWISRPKSRPDPGGPTSTALASAPSRSTDPPPCHHFLPRVDDLIAFPRLQVAIASQIDAIALQLHE